MLRFSLKFFLLTLLFFVVEVLIALFVHDNFIRPYVGDYLVVFLIYCTVSTFLKASPLKIAMGVLLFSYAVEVLQYFNFIERIGLSDSQLAKTVLGYGFEWLDLLAYTFGIATILTLERLIVVYSASEYSIKK